MVAGRFGLTPEIGGRVKAAIDRQVQRIFRARRAGTVLRQRWRSTVPYTLVFDLEMIRIEEGKLLDGLASVDLEGTCRWTFAPVDGGTELRFDVDARTGRWWMNLPIPFANRVVRASFETLMGWGREGLARTLGKPVELRSASGVGARRPERIAARAEG